MAAENFEDLSARDLKIAQSLEYSHMPIDAQLELGVRKLELDVFFEALSNTFVVGQAAYRRGTRQKNNLA